MRLQKFLSMAGVASRRKSEEIIKSGLIKVNNKIVFELGIKINPEHDIIFYKDNIVNFVVRIMGLMHIGFFQA